MSASLATSPAERIKITLSAPKSVIEGQAVGTVMGRRRDEGSGE